MDKEALEIQKDIVRLLTLTLKRNAVQATLIQEMDAVGFLPKRIAELLGTSPNTVSVALHKAKRTKKRK